MNSFTREQDHRGPTRSLLGGAMGRAMGRMMAGLAALSLSAGVSLADEATFVPGEVLVRLAEGVPVATVLDEYAANLACVGPVPASACSLPNRNIHRLAVPQPYSEEEFALLLRSDPRVVFAEFNFYAEDQNPDGTTQSIFLGSTQTAFNTQPLVPALSLVPAHQFTRGAGSVVAVIDSGIDAGHPAVQGRVMAGGVNFVTPGASVADTGDGLDNNGNGAIDEMTGHGTLVAGLVLLVAPEARILPLKVMDSDGEVTTFRLAQAMFHAVDQRVHVMNVSLGTIADPMTLRLAVREAERAGVLVVAAAGNDAKLDEPRSPASLSLQGVISVAAVDDQGVIAPWSNFGPWISISAPGVDVVSYAPGGLYGETSGTSFSAPLVSGVAALTKSLCPRLNNARVRAALRMGAISLDALNPSYQGWIGAGRVNAFNSVQWVRSGRAKCYLNVFAPGDLP